MGMTCPCKYCERKGCGTFHDQCEKYQAYRNQLKNAVSKKDKNVVYFQYRREVMTRKVKQIMNSTSHKR